MKAHVKVTIGHVTGRKYSTVAEKLSDGGHVAIGAHEYVSVDYLCDKHLRTTVLNLVSAGDVRFAPAPKGAKCDVCRVAADS